MEASSSSSNSAPASSSRSYNFDVFLSFRGDDTRKKFVDHLSETLKQHIIKVYKDDEALPRGESIAPSLFKAIEESRIAVIVLSKNYADSSWCLDELAYIMKCRAERRLTVMPIFYDVEPSEVRKQEGNFGEAFKKQETGNTKKAELWRKALVDVSNIAGWETKNTANGHESQVIKKIVDTIFDTLFPLKSNVDDDLVGMRARLHDLEPLLDIGSANVQMVGIWGVGGSGKTTLATSFYKKFFCHFQGHCIVENVREESSKYNLKKLQEDMLSAIFKKEVKVHNVAEGKLKIKTMLCTRKVLVLLDDVDELNQLDALVGSHTWFGSGSRILITSRDIHLLKTHKVDHICPVRLLSKDEAFQLFKTHAYNEVDPIDDYEKLSVAVVSYSARLPLALKVLGSFLYDKDKKGWISTLARLKDIPDKEIMKILRISYDGLNTIEKELFLDIACFWRRKRKDDAIEVLEACDLHPEIGIDILRQKALISIVDGSFDMHDLVQEMAHHIVRGEYRSNPEKHSRVWKNEEINDMCLADAIMVNDMIEAIQYDGFHHVHASQLTKIVSNMKKLRYLSVSTMGYDHDHDRDHDHDDHNDHDDPLCFFKFVWYMKKLCHPWVGIHNDKFITASSHGELNFLANELRYIDWKGYHASSLPKSFQPVKLVVLKLRNSLQEELWKGCKHLPHLKVLVLEDMKKLLNTPDFDGLPRLQKLTLDNCDELKEIHQSLGKHKSLEYVRISHCHKLMMFPKTMAMENLKELNLSSNSFSQLSFSLTKLTRLKILNLSDCKKLRKLPEAPSCLTILRADYCKSLTTVTNFDKNCKQISQVSLMGGGIIKDGVRLLNSMLDQGNFIENQSMLLLLEGLEIPKGFRPYLRYDYICRLVFPWNWYSNACGLLMCAVLPNTSHWNSFVRIRKGDCRFQKDVVWKESNDDKYTLLWYVPFKSLLSLEKPPWNFGACEVDIEYKGCTGLGARLIGRKSRDILKGKEIRCFDYRPQVKIEEDSSRGVTISFSLL